MRVICISGKARHGKDTVAGFLKRVAEDNGQRVLVAHYADYLKYVCSAYLGWNGEKDEAGRTLLQYVGTDVVRKADSTFWVRTLADLISAMQSMWDFVIIPDCRFPNEVNLLRAKGFDVTHIRVVRPGFENGMTSEQQAHESETAMDILIPDAVINNDGSLVELALASTGWYYDTFYTQESIL